MNFTPQRRSWVVHLVLMVAILCGALTFSILSGDELRYPDEQEYHDIGRALARGDGFVVADGEPSIYRPPGYPVFLSIVYRIWDRPLAAKIANSFCLAAAASVLFALVGRQSKDGATISLALVAMYPLFAYTSSTLYPQIPGSLLFLSSLLIMTRQPSRPIAISTGGLIYGCLVLTIPAFLLVFPIVLVYLFLINRRTALSAVVIPAIALLSTILMVTPWTVRNYRTFHRFVPISANAGENFLLGNSENTQPMAGVNTDISTYRAQTTDMEAVDRDRYYRNRAVEWIGRNPASAATLYFGKVVNYFNFRNTLWSDSEQSRIRAIVLLATYLPLLLLSFARLAAHGRYKLSQFEILWYALYFGNAVVSAIFFTRIRFRIPFDFLLIGIVAVFLGMVTQDIARKRAAQKLQDGA